MFHVFVEGAADDSPEGVQRLAEAIANHYGLPAADLHARLKSGRFRVKGNVDRQTADSYVRDLERLGARCTVEEPSAANSRPTPLPFPAVRPATPPAGLPAVKSDPPSRPSAPPSALANQPPSRPSAPPSALADQPASRPSAPPSALAGYARPSTPPPVAGAFTSGLSAAFTPDSASSSGGLGALEREDATFSLASVDGGTPDDSLIEKSPEPAFGVPASIGPAVEKPAEPKKAKPKDVPVDMFAPPDAESADLKVDIADDDREVVRKRVATPPAGAPVVPARAATEPPQKRSEPKIEGTVRASKLGPLADEKVRLVAGVVLAILIGFLPAHFVAKSREKSAYKDIDAQLVSIQEQADTPDAYAALDRTRATFLDRKKDERRNIAMLALVIWGLVGAGVAYGWFRRIPWDDL